MAQTQSLAVMAALGGYEGGRRQGVDGTVDIWGTADRGGADESQGTDGETIEQSDVTGIGGLGGDDRRRRSQSTQGLRRCRCNRGLRQVQREGGAHYSYRGGGTEHNGRSTSLWQRWCDDSPRGRCWDEGTWLSRKAEGSGGTKGGRSQG